MNAKRVLIAAAGAAALLGSGAAMAAPANAHLGRVVCRVDVPNALDEFSSATGFFPVPRGDYPLVSRENIRQTPGEVINDANRGIDYLTCRR